MEYVHAFFDLLEWIMGVGLVMLVLGAFLSMFTPSSEDRYNGAGTLDQHNRAED